jgi:hypothetical protein
MSGAMRRPAANMSSTRRVSAFIAASSSMKLRVISRPRKMFCATVRSGSSENSW